MGKYQYRLEPRTYKTVLRVIDEFWDDCVQQRKNPTLNRLIDYAEKGVKKYEAPKPKGVNNENINT